MTQNSTLTEPKTPAETTPLAGPFDRLALSTSATGPLWRQLFQQLNSMMDAGVLVPGSTFPAERDLAESLGVSRVTVKRCYDELRRDGMLAGRGRAGSVLQAVRRAQPPLGRLKGFTQEMQELGMAASTQLLERRVTTDRAMASLFGRPSGAPLLHVVRVRAANDVPMTREVAWYDLGAAPALADWDGQGSAYAFLREHCGVVVQHAEQTVEAVESTSAEMQAFGLEVPQPCLLFKRRTYAPGEQLIEYVEGTFRGDAYVYRMKLAL